MTSAGHRMPGMGRGRPGWGLRSRDVQPNPDAKTTKVEPEVISFVFSRGNLRRKLSSVWLALCRGCATHLYTLYRAGLFESFLWAYLIPSQCQKGRRARYVCNSTSPIYKGREPSGDRSRDLSIGRAMPITLFQRAPVTRSY